MNWSKICQLMKYADKQTEMTYQHSIRDLMLEAGLGWLREQITEQPSLQLGSTERLIPDIVVTKDNCNCFVIEIKKPGHIKNQKNIDQLVSYMKQIETPVGIYIGDEIEVYYKKIGDGSEPLLLMSLSFDATESKGGEFITLFAENLFSVEAIVDYANNLKVQIAFDADVDRLKKHMTSDVFNEELLNLLKQHFVENGESAEVVEDVLSQLCVNVRLSTGEVVTTITNVKEGLCAQPEKRIHGRKSNRRNDNAARHYAHNLIRKIIDENSRLNFDQLTTVFQNKNTYIKDITKVEDKDRWFMDEDDIITLIDGTRVVVSNQWGFNGKSKSKMDNLRAIANSYGIDISLPD